MYVWREFKSRCSTDSSRAVIHCGFLNTNECWLDWGNGVEGGAAWQQHIDFFIPSFWCLFLMCSCNCNISLHYWMAHLDPVYFAALSLQRLRTRVWMEEPSGQARVRRKIRAVHVSWAFLVMLTSSGLFQKKCLHGQTQIQLAVRW